MSSSRGKQPNRSEFDLQQLQGQGDLQVRTAAEFRELAGSHGLEHAFEHTHVVVASEACLTQQATLILHLGPSDPPIRIRQFRLGRAEGSGGHGNTDLVVPINQGGATALADLLAGQALPLVLSGNPSRQQPKLELETELRLDQIAAGRLLLHRAISENGVVAFSSREGITPTPWGPVLGPWSSALISSPGPGSIGLSMPGLHQLGLGSPVLIAGALGMVSGPGSGHQPHPKRSALGHALSPGACCALEVDLHGLKPQWLRATRLPDGSTGLLVAIAAPVLLLGLEQAQQLAVSASDLEAPLIDYGVPRRVRPSPTSVSYADLARGSIRWGEHRLHAAPAHSPRLAAELAVELCTQLRKGTFPLRMPLAPLPERSSPRGLNERP
ncbi:homocysteine biosynthesis protein [Vulcanococcus sp.]|uniref:homocysteine biosynthesis protein n=1 Tax=Vulcanococcus sp. TaxID=2856995 RepID=UPI003BFFBD31